MKIIIIVDNSTGNETVGEAWQETKIFEASCRLEEVINWVSTIGTPRKKRITITVPDNEGY